MTAGPKLMLGTKCPSITSRWVQAAPPASNCWTSSPRRLKSAERTDGAIRRGRVICGDRLACVSWLVDGQGRRILYRRYDNPGLHICDELVVEQLVAEETVVGLDVVGHYLDQVI